MLQLLVFFSSLWPIAAATLHEPMQSCRVVAVTGADKQKIEEVRRLEREKKVVSDWIDENYHALKTMSNNVALSKHGFEWLFDHAAAFLLFEAFGTPHYNVENVRDKLMILKIHFEKRMETILPKLSGIFRSGADVRVETSFATPVEKTDLPQSTTQTCSGTRGNMAG